MIVEAGQSTAIAEIEKLGGKVTVDERIADKPVIGVSLDRTKVTDSGLVCLKALSRLKSLKLRNTSVTDAGLEQLKALRELRSLDLAWCRGHGHWGRTPHRVDGTSVAGFDGDQGDRHRAGGTQSFDRTPIAEPLENADHRRWTGATEAVSKTAIAGLGCCFRVTDAGLKHLKGLPKLQSLDLSDILSISDVGLERLRGLTQLRSLNLADNKVTDAGLENLKGLTGLRLLNLGETNVTDAGLRARLGARRSLRELNFTSTNVTDVGLERREA